MSRRSRAEKRHVAPDPRYGSEVVSKFINGLMLDGKRSTAESIFYDSMDVVEEKSGQSAINVFQQALTNAKPALEVKSRRVGGATYQVPIEVRPERRQALAIKWMIQFARGRSERSMAERLANLTPQGMIARIDLSLSDEPPYAQAFVVVSAAPASIEALRPGEG